MVKLSNHKKEYVEWLYFDVLQGPKTLFKAYRSLIWTLHSIPFRYTHPMDKNRYMDALDMRMEYYPKVQSWNIKKDEDISVLEVLIALSVRIEKDIMAPALGKNDYFRWFWGMIETLGLDEFDENDYDEGWIYSIIDRFLDRKYDEYGRNGGIFHLQNFRTPMYDLELWDQMNDFLVENYF